MKYIRYCGKKLLVPATTNKPGPTDVAGRSQEVRDGNRTELPQLEVDVGLYSAGALAAISISIK